MEFVLDTNLFKKLLGCDNNSSRREGFIKKLYDLLNDDANVFVLPRYCLYEIATNPKSAKSFKKHLEFCSNHHIKIGSIDNGKIVFEQFELGEIKQVNIEETVRLLTKYKIEYECAEILEYLSYVYFLVRFLVNDIINLTLSQQKNMYSDGIWKLLDKHLSDGEETYKNVMLDCIHQTLTDAYKQQSLAEPITTAEKKKVKNMVEDITRRTVNSIIYDLLFHTFLYLSTYSELTEICNKEMAEIEKNTDNIYQYIAKKINDIEKKNKIAYLQTINVRYHKELTEKHYPETFIYYHIDVVIDSQLKKQRFSKNDVIDNALFYFKTDTNYILTEDGKVLDFIKKLYKENYDYMQSLLEAK